MRKLKANSRLVLIVVASIAVTSSLFGDDAPAPQRAPSIAVIDMARILREHHRLQLGLMDVEQEREEHEASQLQQRRDLDAQMEELNAIESDSLEYRLRRQQIEVAVAELETSNERKQAKFAERNARLYYTVYREIREKVKQFAERNRVDLVLNFDSSDTDSEDPQEIMRRLQDGVVYHSRLNITELVCDVVTRSDRHLDGSRGLVGPKTVKHYPPGTVVMYAERIPQSVHPSKKYVLPRKAADRVVEIANRIKPRTKPTRLGPYMSAPLGSFTVGDSCLRLLQDGVLVDSAFQAASDPVLKKLVGVQSENDWKMDDRVFKAWVRELEKTTAAKKEGDQTFE